MARSTRRRTASRTRRVVDYCQRLGDDALILGQRLSEWCGHAPALEVDLSLANIALDLIGQGTNFLGLAGDADELAFHRDVLDWKNCWLVEQPNGDFAQTMARQLLFSTWQHMLYQRLTSSKRRRIAAIAAKGVKEVAYHRELAADWAIRLGDGTEESARRMAEGLDWCWRFIPELFEVDEVLAELIERGIAADPRVFEDEYRAALTAVLAEASCRRPADQRRSSAAARPPQRASRPFAGRDAASAAHLSRRANGRLMAEHFYKLRVAGDRARDRGGQFDPVRRARRAGDAFRFKAGQHLTLRAEIGGEEVRRNYSLCVAPDEGQIKVTVKRIAGGVFSNWVGDQLKAGDTLDVMTPHGSFTTEFDPTQEAALCRLRRRIGDHPGHVADQDRAQKSSRTAASPCSTATATPIR